MIAKEALIMVMLIPFVIIMAILIGWLHNFFRKTRITFKKWFK
jgi:hypothetical protein